MTDDIVTRLRQTVRQCEHGWNLGNDWYPAPTECASCVRQRDAADEVERLRAAGDALYDALLSADMPAHDYVRVIDAWQETRRG